MPRRKTAQGWTATGTFSVLMAADKLLKTIQEEIFISIMF